MTRNLLTASLVIVALVGALAAVVTRIEHTSDSARTNSEERTGSTHVVHSAVEALRLIAESSQRLMPPGYENVYLSMPLEALRRVRPRVHRDTSAPAPDNGREVWEEDDPSGARVIYLIGSRSRLLDQVQFASRVDSAEELRAHFDAMQDRYGTPTGIWDCPETPESSPMRRFTWRRQGASVMEAVLIYQENIALTLVVAPNEDIARALQRSQCQPVRGREAIANFPVARELRGQQTPFIREVPRAR